MKKEFDFDDIGKKTPYRVPEGFFEEMQRNVRKRTYGSRSPGHRLWITVSTGVAIAAVSVGFLFIPSHFWKGERGTSDLQILDSLRENHFETEVGPGVYDIHSPRVPSVEEIVNALHIMLTKIEKDKLWVNPDCGLKTRGTKETEASLRNMVEAAKEIRKQA